MGNEQGLVRRAFSMPRATSELLDRLAGDRYRGNASLAQRTAILLLGEVLGRPATDLVDPTNLSAMVAAAAHGEIEAGTAGERLASLLEPELPTLRALLSESETQVVFNAWRSRQGMPWARGVLPQRVGEALAARDAADELHPPTPSGVENAVLLAKLRGLTPVQELALVDAAERYWVSRDSGVEGESILLYLDGGSGRATG